MSIHAAISNTLNNDPTLTSLLAPVAGQLGGKSAVFGIMPTGSTMPYITWEAPNSPQPQFSAPIGTGSPYAETLVMTFTVTGTDPTIIGPIAKRMDALLMSGTPIVVDDATNLGFIRRTPLDAILGPIDVQEIDVDVYQLDVVYEAWLSRRL